jgi:hypothetical protein
VKNVLDLVIQKKIELNRSLKWVSYKHQAVLLRCSVRFDFIYFPPYGVSLKGFCCTINGLNQSSVEIFAYFHMNVLLQFMRLLLFRSNVMPLTINR